MADADSADESMKRMFRIMPQTGYVRWIGVRPEKGQPLHSREHVVMSCESGLDGDRFDGGESGTRQVTLIQREHLAVVASILGRDDIDPGLTRRNIVVSGINLQALKNARFRIGTTVLEGTANCPPCSRMETNLGPGGYNAMRGHGGLCAKVIQAGEIRLGDEVQFVALV